MYQRKHNHTNRKYRVIIAIFLIVGIAWCLLPTTANLPELLSEGTIHLLEEEAENEENKRINAEERWEAEFKMIKDPVTGEIPLGIRAKELKAALKVSQVALTRSPLPSIIITSKGPNNYGGRTRALGFDVRNNSIVLAGGVTSGIYRSTNGGANWTRVSPAGVIHSLTCLAQDTRAGQEDTWYAGTGESGSSAGETGASYLGHGIYKSTDNGLTWTILASTQGGGLESFSNAFDFVSRIIVHPTNGDVVASVASGVIQRSSNGGITWQLELGTLTNSRQGDVIYNTVDSKYYAAIDARNANGGVWESTDGDIWTQVRTAQELNPTGDAGYDYDVERIILSNVANTDDVLVFFTLASGYGFSCSGGGSSDAGLAHFDGTSTWTLHTDEIGNCSGSATSPKVISTQGGYNMAMTTKPNDADLVYLGGTESYRYNLSTNAYEFIGGSQQEANSINLHVDNHIMMFEPGSNDIMWSGNDGGLRKTDVTGIIKTTSGDDNGYDWTDRNSDYNGYQYYGVDIDPANGSNFIAGGAQDNAFTIQPTNAVADEVGPTVDGVDVAIISGGSDFNTHNFFMMWQNGSMRRFENGSFTTGSSINPASTSFVGRFYLDADNTNYMYFPSSSGTLHRTRIAESLASSSTTGDSDTGWESMTGISTAVGSNEITALDASRDIQYGGDYSASDANRSLYFGTENGEVFRFNDPAFATAATAPVDITPPGSTGWVSDIAVNPLDDKEILLTYSNYNVVSVWHTSDASVASPTWTNVEGPSGSAVELASARSAMITINDATSIYMVGTSTGLYATNALSGSTTTWTRLGTNTDIGLAVSVEMRLRTSDNKMVLGTHGNGAFLLSFPGAILPVELISFTGRATQPGNLLNWTTASEENNRGFDIEKSNDGVDFTKIGFVAGKETTDELQVYSFMDRFIVNEINYYRLKQVDLDNQIEYTKTITIQNRDVSEPPLALYPNPVQNNLTVENGKGILTIFNVAGLLVLERQIESDKQQINVANLSKGIYTLKVTKTTGESVSRQFIK